MTTEEILLLRLVSGKKLAGSPRRIRPNFVTGLKPGPVRVEPVL